MANEPNPDTEPEPLGGEPAKGGPPPEAVDRLKRERDQLRSERDQYASVAQQALLVDKVHGHLTGKEDLTVKDRYALAKKAAATLPQGIGDDDIGPTVDAWLTEMSSLFTPAQTTPPPPPMASGGDPATGGEPPDSGPYPVNSKEFNEYVAEHGLREALAQVQEGMFYFSEATQAAQATAHGL